MFAADGLSCAEPNSPDRTLTLTTGCSRAAARACSLLPADSSPNLESIARLSLPSSKQQSDLASRLRWQLYLKLINRAGRTRRHVFPPNESRGSNGALEIARGCEMGEDAALGLELLRARRKTGSSLRRYSSVFQTDGPIHAWPGAISVLAAGAGGGQIRRDGFGAARAGHLDKVAR